MAVFRSLSLGKFLPHRLLEVRNTLKQTCFPEGSFVRVKRGVICSCPLAALGLVGKRVRDQPGHRSPPSGDCQGVRYPTPFAEVEKPGSRGTRKRPGQHFRFLVRVGMPEPPN